jgi:hypothetical protein
MRQRDSSRLSHLRTFALSHLLSRFPPLCHLPKLDPVPISRNHRLSTQTFAPENEPSPDAAPLLGAGRGPERGTLALYAATVFLSAFLLFLVQPMFGKMVLPLLGGSPAVWNTCMLFFQAALLGGYLYAHLTSRLGVRRQAVLHLAVLAAAALLLPISVGGAAPRGGEAPVPWLLGVMAATVGAPFFVLAGTGTLLQWWFSHTGTAEARDPYRLYAPSNLGSAVALLGYPFLLEPRLRLAGQAGVWTAGYALLAVLVAACAAVVWRRAGAPAATGDASSSDVAEEDGGPVAGGERARWVLLAFIPSSLLLSVTTYITTDLAPVPLLWVLPLVIYLLSFTLVFARRPVLRHGWMVVAQASLITAVALLLLGGFVHEPMFAIPLHLAALFATAMVCHGELARRRPPVRHLTGFYLWIAVGGVLGGCFNVLVAPVVFTRTWEYPLVLVLAALARRWPEGGTTRRELRWGALRALAIAGALVLMSREDLRALHPVLAVLIPALLIGVVTLGLGKSPLWFGVALGAALLVGTVTGLRREPVVMAHRSFFGRFTVVHEPGAAGAPGWHALYHGSTLHGAQSLTPGRRREPLTYYTARGPLANVFAATADRAGRRRVAIVGLGTGTTAAYARPGESWTFYEIDPGVAEMVTGGRWFTFYNDAPAARRIVLGDARLSLARAPAGAYDLIVLDAFNSDAIPTHLLTWEAFDTYLRALAPRGLLAVHTSNRYLALEPVLRAQAAARGLAWRESTGPLGDRDRFESIATWLVFARAEADLGPLAADSRWSTEPVTPGVRPWTDDFSSLWTVLVK